jgi:hypothetical protein
MMMVQCCHVEIASGAVFVHCCKYLYAAGGALKKLARGKKGKAEKLKTTRSSS